MADAIKTAAEITLADGHFAMDGTTALSLPIESYARTGVVLLGGKRTKVNIIDAETGKVVEFTASIYLQRSPVNEAEAEAVANLSAERDAKAEAKKAAEQAEREKAVKASFQLGQDAAFGALRNIQTLHSAAQALDKLAK